MDDWMILDGVYTYFINYPIYFRIFIHFPLFYHSDHPATSRGYPPRRHRCSTCSCSVSTERRSKGKTQLRNSCEIQEPCGITEHRAVIWDAFKGRPWTKTFKKHSRIFHDSVGNHPKSWKILWKSHSNGLTMLNGNGRCNPSEIWRFSTHIAGRSAGRLWTICTDPSGGLNPSPNKQIRDALHHREKWWTMVKTCWTI